METRASHVLIGSFALAVLVLAFLFVLWLGKLSLDREWAYYDVLFKEAVTGLTVGSAVQYSGIQVGEVRRLQLAVNDPGTVVARIRVAGDTPIKTDTTAKLTFTGLTGVAIIQLGGGSAEAPILVGEGNAVPQIVAEDSALADGTAGYARITTSADAAVADLTVGPTGSGADIILNNVNIVTGGEVSISSASITEGNE
jgi:phospholipid/cholesterol/gamma-HCH transport system substrate-binding protein